MSTVRTQTFFELPSYNGGPVACFTAADGVASVFTTLGIVIGESLEPLGLLTLVDGLVVWGNGGAEGFSVPPLITPAIWNGRFVLEPGEQLFASTNGATTADFYGAGFTLSLP